MYLRYLTIPKCINCTCLIYLTMVVICNYNCSNNAIFWLYVLEQHYMLLFSTFTVWNYELQVNIKPGQQKTLNDVLIITHEMNHSYSYYYSDLQTFTICLCRIYYNNNNNKSTKRKKYIYKYTKTREVHRGEDTPDPAEYTSNLDLTINNKALPMATHLKVLGLTLDPKLTYSTHIHNISVQAHKPLQIIKALTATGWGKQKETLMATYKAVMRPALEYASSVWSPIASSTSINKLQVMQNAALRTAIGCTQDTNIHP